MTTIKEPICYRSQVRAGSHLSTACHIIQSGHQPVWGGSGGPQWPGHQIWQCGLTAHCQVWIQHCVSQYKLIIQVTVTKESQTKSIEVFISVSSHLWLLPVPWGTTLKLFTDSHYSHPAAALVWALSPDQKRWKTFVRPSFESLTFKL